MATKSPLTGESARTHVRDDAHAGRVDWTAIEASPEFRELVAARRRFVLRATAVFLPAFLAYVLLMTYGHEVMATQVIGPITLAWLAGVAEIVMAWVITYAYLKRSDTVFTPMEERAARRAHEVAESTAAGERNPREGRFVR